MKRTIHDVKYARQSIMPDWYRPGRRGYYSIASGSSANNEWYWFPSKQVALKFFEQDANLNDRVLWHDGLPYDVDCIHRITECEEAVHGDGSEPLDIDTLILYSSRF